MSTREDYLMGLGWFKDTGSIYISVCKEYAYDDISKIVYSRCDCCGGLDEITAIPDDAYLREITLMLKHD